MEDRILLCYNILNSIKLPSNLDRDININDKITFPNKKITLQVLDVNIDDVKLDGTEQTVITVYD